MSLSVQFLSLLAMIGTGIVAAAFIDMIGTGIAATNKTSFIRRRAVIFEVLGWTLAGCWTFWVLFTVREGAWRIYDPFAQLSGILLYASFFHKPIRLLGKVILVLFLKPIWFVIYAIFSLVRQVIRLLVRIVIFFFTPFIKIFRKLFGKRFKKEAK